MPFFRTARGDATESRPGTEPGAGPVGDWDETCDRCGPAVRAAYRVHRDGDLYLCGHCTSRLKAGAVRARLDDQARLMPGP